MISASLFFSKGKGIIFKQTRVGYQERLFEMYKFKTMIDFDKNNPLKDKERITKFGKFLRNSSLDEIPELINVIRGEMSLVGPRPLLEEYLPLYNAQQRERHKVKPGITGWAQINGRNSISWEDKFHYDIWYVENQSFFLYIKIILKTAIIVFNRDGIYTSDNKIMPKFQGTKRN